jgi:nucleoside-diphosphate-sugar epimerase
MIMIGSGANHLPLIHVRDAAEGVVAASEAPGATRRAYLLVNDQPVTQWEYLSGIARRLNVGPPRIHIPYRLAMAIAALSEKVGRAARMRRPPPMTRYGIQLLGGDNRFVIRRARQELGFVPRVDLGAGLRESVEWYEREVRGSRGLRASREVPA